MIRDQSERDTIERFVEEYSHSRSAAARQVDWKLLGADVGLNGYTTSEQADVLANSIPLSRNKWVIDIGAGRGWPGFHLARPGDRHLVSTDIPHDALLEARATFAEHGLDENTDVVVADGRALPFRSGSIGGVIHADVLC